MCKTCGCTPCKCGRKIVNKVCEGCGKPYDDCTCKKLQFSGLLVTKLMKVRMLHCELKWEIPK